MQSKAARTAAAVTLLIIIIMMIIHFQAAEWQWTVSTTAARIEKTSTELIIAK